MGSVGVWGFRVWGVLGFGFTGFRALKGFKGSGVSGSGFKASLWVLNTASRRPAGVRWGFGLKVSDGVLYGFRVDSFRAP